MVSRALAVVGALALGVTVGLAVTRTVADWPLVITVSLTMVGLVVFFETFTLGVVAWLAVQNVLIPFVSSRTSGVSAGSWTVVLIIPEAALIVAVIKPMLARVWRRPTVRLPAFDAPVALAAVYGLVVLAAFVRAPRYGPIFGSLNVLREFLVPCLFVLAGWSLTRGKTGIHQRVIKTILFVSVAGAAGAIVDKLFLGSDFWQQVGLGWYLLHVKQLSTTELNNGLPLNMFEYYGGLLVRRAVSFYGDPLAAGYSLATGVLAFVAARRLGMLRRGATVYLIVLLAGIAVTLTRAAFLVVGVVLLVDALTGEGSVWEVASLGVILSVGAAAAVVATLRGQNSSVVVHLHSFLVLPALITHPLGFGVNSPGVPEGLVFYTWWSIGVIPVSAFAVWMAHMFAAFWRSDRFRIYGWLLVAMLLTGFISIELLADTATGAFWLLMGSAISLTGKSAPPFPRAPLPHEFQT